MFSGYESLNLQPLHLKTRCTIIYWFGMSISKCCDVIKHFPYSRAVLLIATVIVHRTEVPTDVISATKFAMKGNRPDFIPHSVLLQVLLRLVDSFHLRMRIHHARSRLIIHVTVSRAYVLRRGQLVIDYDASAPARIDFDTGLSEVFWCMACGRRRRTQHLPRAYRVPIMTPLAKKLFENYALSSRSVLRGPVVTTICFKRSSMPSVRLRVTPPFVFEYLGVVQHNAFVWKLSIH